MLNFVNVRIFSTILLLCLTFQFGMAQDEDYYKPEKSRTKLSQELKDLHRWGPKLGLEVHSAFNYNHMIMPFTIAGSFDKAVGGVGFDGGGGIRIRAYHKLAFAAGFDYAIRQFNLEYVAEEIGTGDALDVTEKGTMHYVGFYYKTLIELSKKFHLAQTFQYTWIYRYNGTASAVNQNTGSPYPPQPTTGPVLQDWSTENQAELGIEFAYKWMISPELILKPYIGMSFGLTPTLHTAAFLDGIFGPAEQNPRYANLKIGIVFETGLWLDKLKE
ncbi:MAG: hypothetical protein ACI9UR_001087 [Bacteroidia bacterium]|jgi:hypothetical protein